MAREQGWTIEFARRAVAECRKFCFLAVTAGHMVTPSDAVNEVWHLQLIYIYSRSYWTDFGGEPFRV